MVQLHREEAKAIVDDLIASAKKLPRTPSAATASPPRSRRSDTIEQATASPDPKCRNGELRNLLVPTIVVGAYGAPASGRLDEMVP